MSIADKLIYLDETKAKLREAINFAGSGIETSDAFRKYVREVYRVTGNYPRSIFADSQAEGVWLNFNDPSALSQSITGINPPGAGDNIRQAFDISGAVGNGEYPSNFESASDAAAPTLVIDSEVGLCADFQGGAWMQSLETARLDWEPRVDEMYICVVAKQTADQTGWLLARTNAANTSDASYGLLFTEESLGSGMRGCARSVNNSGALVPVINEWHIFELIVPLTNPGLKLIAEGFDLIGNGDVGIGKSSTARTYLASRAAGVAPAACRIAEVVMRNELPTQEERQELLEYFSEKYGITLDNPVTPNTVNTGDFSYQSSIDPELTNLYAKWSYDTAITPVGGLPIVVIMHGYVLDAASISSAIMQNWAEFGFFTIAVGMRGRDGADGSPDSGGREIQDIVDAVEKVKTDFASVVNPDRVHISGYSGGGGNVFSVACKFPDYFTVCAAHFGISDYGFDAVTSWGDESSGSRKTQIANWVGARPRSGWPTTNPVNLAKYQSRNTLEAIAVNRLGGHVYIYHDDQDTNVGPGQSERVADAFDAETNTRYSLSITTTTDDPRWIHGLPNPGSGVEQTINEWGQAILDEDYAPWEVADTGTFRIIGWLTTKKFSVWLGDGTDHVADVTYDYVAGEYTVTPLTGTMLVRVEDANGLNDEQTISTATVMTVT